ncbi:MAG: ATP-binding protein [Thermoanaerobaculales bacterium]
MHERAGFLAGAEPVRVLVVDDDPGMVLLLKAVLSTRGHDVTCCTDAEAAWDHFCRNPFPLALLDIGLPAMSGLELCRLMRSHENGHRTVVVAVTAGSTDVDLMSMLEAGADDYLLKSQLSPEFLVTRVAIAENQVRDRTARRHGEEELRASRESFHNVVERLQDGVVVTSESGLLLYLNRAAERMLNRDRNDSLGQLVSPLLRPGEAIELTVRPNDCLRDRSAEMTVVRTEWGGEPALMASLRDVTRLIELQESLRRGEVLSAMGTLVAGVAHEVRNPLFAISATVDAISAIFMNTEGFDRLDAYLKNLKREVDRLSKLMRELLNYSRPSIGEASRCRLASIVAEAITRCSARAADANVQIVTRMAEFDVEVEVEKERIVQAVENLLTNALSFSPVGGRVTVECATHTEDHQCWACCSVSDQGPGISPEDLPHIFEPFFTRRQGGTGLGLSLAQRIVSEHGGTIVAESGPNGAVFTVQVPCIRENVPEGNNLSC